MVTGWMFGFCRVKIPDFSLPALDLVRLEVPLMPHWATGCRDTDEKEANVLFIHSFSHSCTQIKCCKCLVCLNPQQISEADDPLEFQAFCILIMYNFVIFVGKVKTKKDLKKV